MELEPKAKSKGPSPKRKAETFAMRKRREELIAEAGRIRSMTPGPLEDDSMLILRKDRDSR